jgi:hypothetical protein
LHWNPFQIAPFAKSIRKSGSIRRGGAEGSDFRLRLCTEKNTPSPVRAALDTHLRHHPILQEWVIYASHRQDRTFLPPAESDPLAPTTDPEHPTELPTGDYDVAVSKTAFPAWGQIRRHPRGSEGAETGAAVGACEIVVFSQGPDCSLAKLPVDHITLILDVWADRTCELQRAGMAYVLPFENRGVEMGVTLHAESAAALTGEKPAVQPLRLARWRAKSVPGRAATPKNRH